MPTNQARFQKTMTRTPKNKAAAHSENQSNDVAQKNLPQTGDGILLLVVSCVAILGIVGAAVAIIALRNKKSR